MAHFKLSTYSDMSDVEVGFLGHDGNVALDIKQGPNDAGDYIVLNLTIDELIKKLRVLKTICHE